MNYGKALRIVRGARGITQKDVAEKSGLHGNYISMIESGRRAPSVEAIHSIAAALDVPVYLFSLLASEPDDLRGISPEHAELLGQQLLGLLIGNEASSHGSAR